MSEDYSAAVLMMQDAVAPTLPSSIKPVPASLFASFMAWWGLSRQQTADAELFLYKKTGFFRSAQVANASKVNDDGPNSIAEAFAMQTTTSSTSSALQASSASSGLRNTSPTLQGNEFATIATQLGPHGKVGYMHSVNLSDGKHSPWSWKRRTPTQRYIHTVEIGTPKRKEERPDNEVSIVLVHGYGAGSAFFFRNLGALAKIPNTRLYALDWLGMGRSSRPSYSLGGKPRSMERVEASESFFLDALEEWRTKMHIDRMVLVGHSLGGYLSTAYALRFPERVSKLILVSPVGFPEGSLQDMMKHNPDKRAPRFGPRTIQFMSWLWDKNVSPFSILRFSTVLGPLLMGGYTRRRFGSLAQDELQSLHAYCHGIFTDHSSSEHCLADILAPGAFARRPMAQRVAPLKIPIVFLYGDHDWMDIRGAYQAREVLHEAGNNDVRIHTVKNAGHHLYLDNPSEFNELLEQGPW